MARQTIVSTQQAERITDRALRHIRPIFGKCYGYPDVGEGTGERHEILPVLGTRFDQDAARPELGAVHRQRGQRPAWDLTVRAAGDRRGEQVSLPDRGCAGEGGHDPPPVLRALVAAVQPAGGCAASSARIVLRAAAKSSEGTTTAQIR